MRCNCESLTCERLGAHQAGACHNEAGAHEAMYVGRVCDACARRIPKKYMLEGVSMRRFTVIRVNRDPSDTHAAGSFEQALRLAIPDPGSYLEVWVVKATDAGAARLMPPTGNIRSWYFRGGR